MRRYLQFALVAVILSVPLASCASLEGQLMLRDQIAELTESNKSDQATLVALVSSNALADEFDKLLDDLIATDLTADQWFGIEPYITDGQAALKVLNNEEAAEEDITEANVKFESAMVGMRRWHARIFPNRITPVIPTNERPSGS